MNEFTQIERDHYSLIITRNRGSEILLSTNDESLSLPSIEIPAHRRIAEQLTETLRAKHHLETFCLFTLNTDALLQAATRKKYAVLEILNAEHSIPDQWSWCPASQFPSVHLNPPEDNDAFLEAIQEIDQCRGAQPAAPFVTPGWIQNLLTWAQVQIDPLHLRLTGAIRQFNASSTFSLMRLETTGPAVWFKATGQPNLHELPVSKALARLFPEYVPKILGVHPVWNGWLSEEAWGNPLDDCSKPSAWEKASGILARLQIASTKSYDELLQNGCKDLRLSKVEELVDPFLARMEEFMAAQTKHSPEPLSNRDLRVLRQHLKAACQHLQHIEIPDTLGHLDFNPGNIVVSPTHICFLDWAEGCVTHPFVTFEYLREYATRKFAGNARAIQKIGAAYLAPWRSLFSPDTLRQAAVLSPLIAVLVAATADPRWQSANPRAETLVAGYFRSLARRMFREANITGQRTGSTAYLEQPHPVSPAIPRM